MKKYHRLSTKFILLFVILFLLVALGMGELIYNINYRATVIYSERQITRCGKYIDKVLDADDVKKWIENGEDESYDIKMKDLEGIHSIFGLTDLYVYRPCYDENGELANEVVYIIDIHSQSIDTVETHTLGDRVDNINEYDEMKKALETGEVQTTDKLRIGDEEELLTALVPMKLDNGEYYAVAVVCASMSGVVAAAATSSLIMLVVFEIVVIIFAAAMLIFVGNSIIKPIKILSGRMDNYVTSGAGLSEQLVTEIHTHDEIEQMADNFNSMAESIRQYTRDMQDMTVNQERLRAELDVAGSIRSAVSSDMSLPAFSERNDFELYASLKNTVYNSCSFCKYFLMDEDHLIIVLGESVGKNLPSMLMSMLASTNICALAGMGVEPYKIAYDTNNSLCGFERNNMSMTVSALIIKIELSSGEMKYVNAGMPPVIIKDCGEEYVCESGEMQFNLGEMHGVSFSQNTIHLSQGNTIFLTSYGVPEMKNNDDEKFTQSRLVNEINDISKQHYQLTEMTDELEMRLDAFRMGREIELDTTILGFRYFG